MARLIQIPIDETGDIFIETSDVCTGSYDPMFEPASGSDILNKGKEYLDSLSSQIKSFSTEIASSIRGIADEVELEFSIKVGSDSGIIISSVSTEATMTVTLKWRKDKEG